MRFAVTAATLFALATSVFAQTADFDALRKPEANEKVPAGQSYEVTWDIGNEKYTTGNVKIHLIGGETQQTLVPLMDIASK
jgi:hypothetical protein